MAESSPDIDWRQVLGPLLNKSDAPHGGEIEALSRCVTQHAPRAIRQHPRRCYDLPFVTHAIPWFQGGFWVADPELRPGAWLEHAAGDYFVQDAGSMLAIALCEIQPGQVVIDTCASPGGKASGLAELLGPNGCLVANEVISSRVLQLQASLERTGLANYLVCSQEVDRLGRWLPQQADCVLVDAPCSGQSMIAKGKQSLSAFSEKQIEHNAARQQKLIRHAAQLVKPGGRLVYSTCTFSYAENERIAEQFLEENHGWQACSLEDWKSWESPIFPGCYRLWPHRHSTAGAFAAVLQRDSDLPASVRPERSKLPSRWHSLGELPVGLGFELRDELAEGRLFTRQKSTRGKSDASGIEEIHLFPEIARQEWIEEAISGARIAKKRSVERRFSNSISRMSTSVSRHARAATRKPKSKEASRANAWEPCFASAKLEVTAEHSVELGSADARRYVQGQTIRLSQGKEGWTQVLWRSRPLSWGKVVNGTLKNHFPKTLRQQL